MSNQDFVPPQNTVTGLPPRRKNTSTVWEFFTVVPDSDRAQCNFCNALLKCTIGTTSMMAHARRCKGNPNAPNKRMRSTTSSTVTSPSLTKFDQEKCRQAVVKMIVTMELPYRHVEHPGFRECIGVLQPKFSPISRSTVARDALLLCEAEKTKLKCFLSQQCRSVCLTTDSWTSCQNMGYMCITAHFIDNNWTLHKKILNFPQVIGCSGDVVAKKVLQCATDWELNQVLTVTVDNASANDRGIEIIKMRLNSNSALVMNGDHMHMHCCAHIINLIVKEGLKEIDVSVVRIRNAIKLIRISTSRYRKFLSCVKKRHIKYKGLVNFDCETRWNATHDMLKAALKLQEAFVELEVLDAKYCQELNKGKGVPAASDWQNARVISTFLEVFKNATLRVSGSSYVTSNIYMAEVFALGMTLKETITSTTLDSTTVNMAKRMRDKYWGDRKSLNMLLLIAFVLDPRKKMKVANWFIDGNFDAPEASELKKNLDSSLKDLYDAYSGGVGEAQSDLLPTQFLGEGNDPDFYLKKYLMTTGAISSDETSSDLSKYLNEALEHSNPDFNILNWWRVNATRLPILASIARDVLAIPVSTVASESAFSTGGRVVDEYRSSLTAQSVEALICTADWLNGKRLTLFPSEEDLEEIEIFEREIFSGNIDGGASSSNVTLAED